MLFMRVHEGVPSWHGLLFMRVHESIPSWNALPFMQAHEGIPPWHALLVMRVHEGVPSWHARHHNHPRPSTGLTNDVKECIERLKQEAEWGEKMRPSGPDWVIDSRSGAVQIQKQLLGEPPHMTMTTPQRVVIDRRCPHRSVEVLQSDGSAWQQKRLGG